MTAEGLRKHRGGEAATYLQIVQAHYGRAAGAAAEPAGCGAACGSGHYSAEEIATLPEGALAASDGCANPVALAELRAGETVLDLGSGGGIDVLLSARRVGPSGKAIGLDMTEEMLRLARENLRRSGLRNAEFLRGRIEDIPLPDGSVDVVLSNCVVNLSADKEAVFAEAHRVLRPGGRLAVADIVAVDASVDARVAARFLAGRGPKALTPKRYREALGGAGFVDVEILESHEPAPGYRSVLVRAAKPPRP